jgi:hypothetical protein
MICDSLVKQEDTTIFRAVMAMHNYYLQQGVQIVFIKGDGEFKPLKDLIELEQFGGLTMNLTSANEHVQEIERKIRVIKEQLRAIIYSMPVNAVPSLVMIHMVLFVTKVLNIFPVKGGIPVWSPKQINRRGHALQSLLCSFWLVLPNIK